MTAAPYPGLRPFEESDREIFFGREAQIVSVLGLLQQQQCVAIVGSSGSGKSSLIRAGVIPAIREGFLRGARDWKIIVLKPGNDPCGNLARALKREGFDQDFATSEIAVVDCSPMEAGRESERAAAVVSPALDPTEDGSKALVKRLCASDRSLIDVLTPPRGSILKTRAGTEGCGEASLSAALTIPPPEESRGPRVLILVDQFEEIFSFRRIKIGQSVGSSQFASRDEAATFVRLLLCACDDPDGRISVVITMRSDFIGDCEAFLGLPERISRSQFLVPRLDRGQMEDAIVRPAGEDEGAFKTFTFEEGLVNRIINDAGDRPDLLPLMQHALMRTWKCAIKRAGADGPMKVTPQDYEDAGGIELALSNDADAAWGEINKDPKRAQIARRLFLLLCDISPDGQITRRRPQVAEVQGVTDASVAEIEQVVRIFQQDDRNFLLPPPSQPLTTESLLDISHEALLRRWWLFSGAWQEEERSDASELRRLSEQASLHEQHKGGLILAEDLERVGSWKKRVSAEWARRYVGKNAWEAVLGFVEESQAEAGKRVQEEQARQQRELEAAKSLADERARGAVRLRTALGIVAALLVLSVGGGLWALYEKSQGEKLLWQASRSDSEESLRKLKAEGEWNTAVAYGARALRICPDNAAAAWRLFGHTLLAGMAPSVGMAPSAGIAPSRILKHDDPVMHARILTAGALITVSGEKLRRWEPVDGRWTSREVFAAEKREKILALSADGKRLCLLASDGSVRLWDLSAHGAGPALGVTKPSAAVFSPDGGRLLTMNGTGSVVAWDTGGGAKIASLPFDADPGTTAAVSPDGSRILIGTKGGSIRCLNSIGDGGSWKSEWTLKEALKDRVVELMFSPDGSRFAALSGDGTVGCWSMPTQFQVATLKGEEPASCVAYSDDGSMVATGGASGSVELWERASGKHLAYLRGHRKAITSLCFSSDARFLLTASEDTTARIWEVAQCPPDALEPADSREKPKIPPAPAWVYENLLPFLCGKELDREGKISDLSVERQLQDQVIVEQRLDALRSEPALTSSPWDRYLKWKFLSDSRTRPICPEAAQSVPDYVEKNIWKASKLADEAKLRAVWLAAPGHPLVQWALGKTHSGGKWGEWLRDQALPRLSDPAAAALYGATSVAGWSEKRASIGAAESLLTAKTTNSLEMEFAPVQVSGGKTVMFSVWETRVGDYEAYAGDPPGVYKVWRDGIYDGGHKGGGQMVSPSKDSPVASVSWDDANGFCEWLTKHEREKGTITAQQRYRLPTDDEWSWAVGIGEEEEEALRGRSPKDKDQKVIAYPWGTLKYPPIDDKGNPLGNYADSATALAFPGAYVIPHYTDGYATTSPVGKFPPGPHGLYDLGGNVWEWCQDWLDPAEKKYRVVRGASWLYNGKGQLLSSYRGFGEPDFLSPEFGFRCVLSEDESAPLTNPKKSSIPDGEPGLKRGFLPESEESAPNERQPERVAQPAQ